MKVRSPGVIQPSQISQASANSAGTVVLSSLPFAKPQPMNQSQRKEDALHRMDTGEAQLSKGSGKKFSALFARK
jgi:hypothetical protein